MKDKSHMIISIDAEELSKIQQVSMIKKKKTAENRHRGKLSDPI